MNNIGITKEFEEMGICNQALRDKNWSLIKRFRKKIANDKYEYYSLIKCNICEHEMVVKLNRLYCPTIVCPNCSSPIGKTYGCYKVLEFDHTEFRRNRNIPYYKVQCIQCGEKYIKELNKAQWSTYNKCKHCTPVDDPGLHNLLNNYKYSAKKRGLNWSLTVEQFNTLVNSNCYYCGSSPESRTSNKYTVVANGIDRIDSNNGYTIDNCVPCCTKCNYMKLNYTTKDFLSHIEKIYNHSKEGSTTIEKLS